MNSSPELDKNKDEFQKNNQKLLSRTNAIKIATKLIAKKLECQRSKIDLKLSKKSEQNFMQSMKEMKKDLENVKINIRLELSTIIQGQINVVNQSKNLENLSSFEVTQKNQEMQMKIEETRKVILAIKTQQDDILEIDKKFKNFVDFLYKRSIFLMQDNKV